MTDFQNNINTLTEQIAVHIPSYKKMGDSSEKYAVAVERQNEILERIEKRLNKKNIFMRILEALKRLGR